MSASKSEVGQGTKDPNQDSAGIIKKFLELLCRFVSRMQFQVGNTPIVHCAAVEDIRWMGEVVTGGALKFVNRSIWFFLPRAIAARMDGNETLLKRVC